jgi:hypothetical protein
LGGRGRQISEFEASLVYNVSSRTAKVTQRNSVWKNKQTNKQTNKYKKNKKTKSKQINKKKKRTMQAQGVSLPITKVVLP